MLWAGGNDAEINVFFGALLFWTFGFLYVPGGQRVGVILNTWKQPDNLKGKHEKDTNKCFVGGGWDGAWGKNAWLDSKNGNRFYRSNLLIRSLDNVLPWSWQLWVPDIPSFIGFGWRGLLPLSKKMFFSWVSTESSRRLAQGALLPSPAPLLLLRHFY